jgi:phytoene synthase
LTPGEDARPTRDAIVATAAESIARGSRSFGAAARLFGRRERERAWLLYAWCRRCDDIVDGQDHGHGMAPVEDAPARVAEVRRLTDAALDGVVTGDPAFDALGVLAREVAIPHALAHDLIRGFELDADDWRPRSEGDLYRYCYHVAGTVGCLMAIVMGVPARDQATLDRACDLGIAFQLANIARDVEEDDRVARCYLPVEWLVEMDMPPGQHMKPPFRDRLVVLVRRLAERAELHEASARVGTKALSFRSAWAVLAAAGIYGDIAREVTRRGAHAWDHRVSTSAGSKLGWIARAFAQAARRQSIADTPRDPRLWTRPR